jgi:hypothetical protein
MKLVTELLHDDALDVLVAAPVPLVAAAEVYAELARGVAWSPPQRVFDCER